MKKFGRSKEHRKALMQSLVTNLILVESIKTTLPKAKQARKDARDDNNVGTVLTYRAIVQFL